jgi:hypothetical protein
MDIIREAQQTCQIYSASYNAKYYYPYKLRKVGNGWEALDKSCFELIIDSNIRNSSVTNEEILDEVVDTPATKVIPKDYLDQPERTIESLQEFESLVEKRNIQLKADVIPILQDPHVEHLKEHESFYSDYTHIAIGGIKGNRFETEEKVRRMRQIRDILGDKVHIHGFGMGCSLDMIKALRTNPSLLDSFDMATAEQMVMNGKVTDWTFNQQEPNPPMPKGEDSTVVNGGFSKSVLVMLNYMLTDRVTDSELREMFINELGMDKVQDVVEAATGENIETPLDLNRVEHVPDEVKDSPIDNDQKRIKSFGNNN